MPKTLLNASGLYEQVVDPRSVNQILRDSGMDDEAMARFWTKIGIPITEAKQTVSLTDILVRLAGVAAYPDHPFGVEIDAESFGAFLLRQGFSPREGAEITTRMGWNLTKEPRKKIAAIITRMAKAIARPGVIQG